MAHVSLDQDVVGRLDGLVVEEVHVESRTHASRVRASPCLSPGRVGSGE